MRIKLDENLPLAMAKMLRDTGYDVETVPDENLSGKNDDVILKKATQEDRVLLTFDLDFADVREYPPGTHAGIVVFRIHDQRWESLQKPVARLIDSGRLNDFGHGLAIVDENRIRVRFDKTAEK